MTEHTQMTINRAVGNDTAAIFDSLLRLERADLQACKEKDCKSLHTRLQVGHDNWMTGALFISQQVAEKLYALVDFDAWQEAIGGVFTYEHLEYGTGPVEESNCLPAALWRALSEDMWYAAAANYQALDDAWLDDLIRTWAATQGVPVKAVPGLPKRKQPNRFQLALQAQEGACNPVPLLKALPGMLDELRDDKGYLPDTATVLSDPALRAMLHQLAHLFRLMDVDRVDNYSAMMEQVRLGAETGSLVPKPYRSDSLDAAPLGIFLPGIDETLTPDQARAKLKPEDLTLFEACLAKADQYCPKEGQYEDSISPPTAIYLHCLSRLDSGWLEYSLDIRWKSRRLWLGCIQRELGAKVEFHS